MHVCLHELICSYHFRCTSTPFIGVLATCYTLRVSFCPSWKLLSKKRRWNDVFPLDSLCTIIVPLGGVCIGRDDLLVCCEGIATIEGYEMIRVDIF